MGEYDEVVECGHGPLVDMAMKCEQVFSTHENALVSISGGSDSDIMLDLCERVRTVAPIDVTYVWFDTGIEYAATRRHVDYLEERYGVEILRERAEKPIPLSCVEYGQPFVSKHVSTMCERLQKVGFKWEDEPYEALSGRYTGQVAALKWWSNKWSRDPGEPGWFDIGRTKWLREFMVENPPWFKISARCCEYAKKKVSRRVEKRIGCDLVMVGVRRSEGGVRASHNKCFNKGDRGIDTYRPLFWLSNDDKAVYKDRFKIKNSDCYEVWGYRRTGCAGCPFGRNRANELEVLEMHEPKIARACRKVFEDSYRYTEMFEEYRHKMENEARGQMVLAL